MSTIFLLALGGCASGDDAKAEEDVVSVPKARKPQAPKRPEYHAESDAVSFYRGEAKAYIKAGCAALDDPEACRAKAGTRIRGYRGAFSQPGVDEVLVQLPGAAALLAEAEGSWKARAISPEADIESCLLGAHQGSGGPNKLLCRAATSNDWGLGLRFFGLTANEAGELEVHALEVPHASDIDTPLFSGWKSNGRRIELRFHKQRKITGESTVNFGGPDECAFRTFGYDGNDADSLTELESCTGEAPKEAGTELVTNRSQDNSAYENRIQEPLRKHNRDYAMCYQREVDRIEEVLAKGELAKEDPAKKTDGEGENDQEKASEDDGEKAPEQPAAGEIQVRVVIGSSGAPVSCEVVESTLENENIEGCLCDEMMRTEFPSRTDGRVFVATLPFGFAPAE